MSVGHKVRVILRQAVAAASIVLPREKSLKVERYLRGMEDFRMIGQSDAVVVSFGKSGRTWLRVLLSRYYQQRYKLPSNRMFEHDNFHALNSSIPRLFFTHDNYLSDYTGKPESRSPYANSKVVLLARHPADTAISQYHQWKHRMRGRKKAINGYPESDSMSLFDFVVGESAGIPKIVRFMNIWAKELQHIDQAIVVRYESLRAHTAGSLERVLDFLGEKPTADELAECVSFASIENMRAMEKSAHFKGGGDRMKPADINNPDSYKVRRAKAGGYRDDFNEDQLRKIDQMVKDTLAGFYGYSGDPPDRRVV